MEAKESSPSFGTSITDCIINLPSTGPVHITAASLDVSNDHANDLSIGNRSVDDRFGYKSLDVVMEKRERALEEPSTPRKNAFCDVDWPYFDDDGEEFC